MFKIFSETDKLGTIYWYIEGTFILHREDGPAVEWYTGDKFWYLNGKTHRVDGPAIEYANRIKVWCQNDMRHRTDGPAVEYSNGENQYWLYGIYYEYIRTNEEWIIFQIIN